MLLGLGKTLTFGQRKIKIVTDGLVLNLDAGNAESYPGSGTTWYDISGNGNNGTLTNGPTYDSANKGSIVFDGVNDSVISTNDSSLQIYEGTISVWIKAKNGQPSGNAGYNAIVVKPNAWGILLYSDKLVAYDWGNSARRDTGVDIGDDAWHHVVMAFTNTVGTPSNNVTIYIDTNSVLTTTVEHVNHNNSLYIGNSTVNQPIEGNISSVQIYNRALSSTEIQQNYDALKGRYGL